MADYDLSLIPPGAIDERHLAGTGPGGQNVNKVASVIQLRVDIDALDLAPAVYRRLKAKAGSKMTAAGMLVITARRRRTQEANRREAMDRLAGLLGAAHERPAYRVETRPSRAAKAKRIEGKKARGQIKKARGKPQLD